MTCGSSPPVVRLPGRKTEAAGSQEKTADISHLDWEDVGRVESAMDGGEIPRRA